MTPEQAQQLFDYFPDTGEIRWKRGRHCAGGRAAGTLWENGYVRIRFETAYVYAHRVAWAITHGYWPVQLDHVNGDRTDNRIVNLRECTHSQNGHKKRLTKPLTTSKYRGVYWSKQKNKWHARMMVDSRVLHLGFYADARKAALAFDAAAREHFGEFACPNFAGVN